MWRVLTGLNRTIQISFLPAGHTKFAPDWCFGLLKQKFRRTDVDSLLDFANVVNQSASVNKAQLVGETNGNVIVPTYDWTSHIAVSFKKIVGIKGYYHFKADAASPGKVLLRCVADGPVTEVNILKVNSALIRNDLPPVVPPKGLTSERQWYLYDKIRRYCREECKDLTCPLPEAPRPVSSSRQSTPGIDEAPELGMEIELPQSDTETNAPPTKKRQCGNCGQYGHNRRRCPNSDN